MPTAVVTSRRMIAVTSVNQGLTSVVTNIIAASTINRMYQTTVTTLAEIHIQINTMNDAASSPQKRARTAVYVARAVTGSLFSRWATSVRVAPPITTSVDKPPPRITQADMILTRTDATNVLVSDVLTTRRIAMPKAIQPADAMITGGAAVLISTNR